MTHVRAQKMQKLQKLRRSWIFLTSASNNAVITDVFIEMQKLQKLNRIASLIRVFFFMKHEKDSEKKEFFRGVLFSASNFCNICKTINIPFTATYFAADVGAEVKTPQKLNFCMEAGNELS